MTTQTDPSPAPAGPDRPRRGFRRRPVRHVPWPRRLARAVLGAGAVFVAFAVCLTLAAAVLGGRPLPLPVWAVAETEARLNRALGGQAVVSLGGVELSFPVSRRPQVRLQDLRLMHPDGRALAQLPEATAEFDAAALMRGSLRPQRLRLSGAQAVLRRAADGSFDLDLGQGLAMGGPTNLAGLLDRVDRVLALPILSGLKRIEAEALTLTLDDRRSGRVWTVGDGSLTLEPRATEVALSMGFGLVGGGQAPARAQLTFVSQRGSAESRFSAVVDQVAAGDIAAQSPVLGWLGVIDAPISGDLRAGFDASGALTGIEGALGFGAGALSPVPGARPVRFDRAGIAFGYDPAAQRIEFRDLTVDSPTLHLVAAGHSYLTEFQDGVPGAFLGQVRLSEVRVNPEGVFTEPVRFSEGAVDLRLRLDPFSLDLGQLTLVEDGRRLGASGRVSAGADGWTVAVDLGLDVIRHDRLLALWPVSLVPRTREWLVANVQEGTLFDVKAGLRLRPGEEPRLSLGYEFSDADVRFMRTLPPIRGGHGYATIEGSTYTMVVDRGRVTPPAGGDITVVRSVLRVPDFNVRPPPAEITLHTTSSVTAALSLLDQPPFGFLSRASIPVDLAQGQADVTTELRLPLANKVGLEDVDFAVTGSLTDVVSDRFTPGRMLRADRLRIDADPASVRIGGAGMLGQVPFDAVWSQALGPPAAGATAAGSKVAGSLTLSDGFAREFLPGLPGNTLTGSGRAEFQIDLARGAAPQLRLTSDLVGAGVRIDAIGWSKPASVSGRLEVAGSLGTPPRLDALSLDAPGLSASGSLSLRDDGAFDALRLSQVRLGRWLDGSADIVGRGPGQAPDVRVTGGSADLRQMPESGPAGGGGGAGAPARIGVALDRVTVSSGIALTGVRGDFGQRGGLNGSFAGLVNGKAPVSGRIEPSANGTAVRITSDQGGEAAAAAGLFSKAFGGTLDLVLTPTGGRGNYDGALRMTGVRVRNMPVLAELLNAISIVGLLEQLSTSGLLFGQVDGRFRLTPDAVELRQGSATGASFGVSLEGVYRLGPDQIDMRGVISPLYLVNGIGAVLTRKGEGLIGVNYRIRGSAQAPQVSVNPLSLLAPGFFREMLRRPAARLDDKPGAGQTAPAGPQAVPQTGGDR